VAFAFRLLALSRAVELFSAGLTIPDGLYTLATADLMFLLFLSPARPAFQASSWKGLVCVWMGILGSVNLCAETPPATPAAPKPSVVGVVPDSVKLDLSRRDLKNFLTDKDALVSYPSGGSGPSELRDVFTLGSVDTRYAVFWDPLACRLIGILDLEAPPESIPLQAPSSPSAADTTEKVTSGDGKPTTASPYLFKAEGGFPLSKTSGASDQAQYFGFRIVKGVPEFLYRCGSLLVEERIWLDHGGTVMKQRFFVKQATHGLKIAVPVNWAGRVAASSGTWTGALLTVPQEAAAEIILTFPLSPTPTSAPVAP